jgi:hypothetical protein
VGIGIRPKRFIPVPDWPDADQSGIPAVSDYKTVLFAAFFSRSSTKLPTIELKGTVPRKSM